ncbi:MAG: class I SAM-dependent methyltransferase [Pirellulales bacterium]
MAGTPTSPWPISSSDPQSLADYAALVGVDTSVEWMMESGEQLALLALAQGLRPQCTIEVGSHCGGSMQIFSRYSQRVISCDIDPTCPVRLGPVYPNVEFVTGPSHETLPRLLDRLQREQVAVGLMLIDGDHSLEGVQGDIHALIGYRPITTMYVVMHDSFNPSARKGIRTARWHENPYVHSVELDFIPGMMHKGGKFHREMWGGFALAQLRPEARTGPLTISARKEHFYRTVWGHSVHGLYYPLKFMKRAVSKIGRTIGIRK